MERIEGLSIGLDLETMKVDSGLKDLKSKLTLVNSEMKANLSAFDRSERSVGKYETRLNGLNKKIEVQRAVTENARKTYGKMVDEFGEGSKEAEKAASEYNKQSSNLQNLERYIERTTDELKKLKEEQRIANSNWTKMGEHMTVAGDKMQKFGRGMTDFGKSYSMKVTAPIVASGVAVFKAASDYESAFAGVAKTFSGTEEQLADLRVGIRDMAKEIPASTTEIAAVAEAAGQLGIKAESIEEFTRTMIDLGEATNMTSDQAATEFARFANIVGMSQEDFDKMGSSIVALGNSMATTEAEISSMAMRLAAQGKQVGMTEAQILALSGTMSSLGIEAEAGGTAMTTVLKKIDSAVGEGGKSLSGFAKAAGVSSKDFSKAWNDDPIKALDTFIKGLGESSKEGKNLTSILTDLGIKGIRESDTILRLAGASDLLSEAVNTSSKAWEENTALSDEAAQRYATTESKLKILWNRAKDMAITTGEALVPAVMDLLDAAEPLIKKIEDGAQAFADMSKEEQQTILKTIALVAAIGPASIGIGALSSGIGGLLKVGGSVATMLGKAGGTGLLGRIAGFGLGGPVGLAVGGLTALGAGMVATVKYFEETNEATFETVRAMNEEIEATDELIARFEELQRQNGLTTEEMLEYMDILDALSSTSSPDKIAELKERQAELEEQSGFTRDEMQEFLDLNDKIIEQAPNATTAISDQGNAYADNLQALKELNEAKRVEMMMIAERELMEGLQKEAELLLRQSELERELVDLRKQRSEAQDQYISSLGKETEIEGQITEIKAEMFALEQQGYEITDDKMKLLAEEIGDLQIKKQALSEETEEYRNQLDEQEKIVAEKEEGLDSTYEELKRLDDLKYEYEALWLAQLDINSEKGKSLIAIDEEIQKQKDLLKHMEDNTNEALKNTDEYRLGKEQIENQIERLEEAKGELEQINNLAAETAYEKGINISTNPSIDKLNRDLASGLTKRINIDARINGAAAISPYAKGTPPGGHPGGLAVVGDGGGSELIHTPDGRSFLSPSTDTLMDLPKGTHVIPHEKTKRLLSFTPKYAGGTRNWESLFNLENASGFMKLLALLGMNVDTPEMSGTSGSVSNTNDNNEVVLLLQQLIVAVREGKNLIVNDRVLGQVAEPIVTEIQERNKRVRESFV